MNKAQKDVLKASLNDEKKTIRELKQVYSRAKLDCEERIRELSMRTDMENLQSIIYQKKYQEVLKNQLDDILDKLNSNQFDTISDYLNVCYENGYIGTMYDLQYQGIPFIVPINQKQVTKAIQVDTKLSSKHYKSNPLKGRLAEDVTRMKVSIRAEISRGIANGSSWNDIAVKIATGMNNPIDKAYKDAIRIARTEGHRVQQSAILDAQRVAKEKGADVLKQWDSTMDSKTRPTHQRLDGQIREIEEPFEINGKQAMFAGDFGIPSEDINCRCTILQRARWALDEDELKTLQERAEFFGLDKTKDFEEYKKKFNIVSKENPDKLLMRTLPEIEFDAELHGLNNAKSSATLKKFDDEWYTLTLDSAENIPWDSIPKDTQNQIRWTPPYRENQPFGIKKGDYGVRPYVAGSSDRKAREEIAERIGGEYVGTSWFKKYNRIWEMDVYQKDGQVMYSLGKAEMKKTLSTKSLNNIIKVAEEREKLIGEALSKKGIKYSQLKAREGDDWVEAMKEFHKGVYADGFPQVLSKAEYDSIENTILYRGIAPQSHLRRDITTNLTTQQMADGFFKDVKPFPSRGIYGDGVAYCSPSLEKIGGQYASANGTITSGGKIIEFKLKPDAKTISYEDAVFIFEEVANKTNSNLLFNKNQRKSQHEVGKAMNALGYDAIIKENGDNTGVPFYVILNREALVTKEDWTTVTVTPEWLRKVKWQW